jgi:phospho-N-acetylmuramoyl-pentapeptide-transferase
MLVFIAFLLTITGMPSFIRWMQKKQIGEMVREEGPKTHQGKAGTPTMGGLFLIVAVLVLSITAWIYFQSYSSQGFFLLYLVLAYGSIGFIDDYRKTIRKSAYGLKAREDITLQLILALPFVWFLLSEFSFSYLLVFLALFKLLVILSVSNSVNLSDGLDGLLSGLAIPIFVFYFFYGQAYAFPWISQFALILIGTLLGFLFYNAHPAKIFMGNVGSFAIGGAIAGMALITHTEWILLILGALFVLEALSVIIQVGYFKYSRKKTGIGKRIFKMAPIHHHFELKGYPEPLIVVRFWLIQIIMTMIAWFVAVKIF